MSTIKSNLPLSPAITDSADDAKRFFNNYYQQRVAVSSSSLDAAIIFFKSRGFSDSAAQSVGGVLISQAKIDGINVFKLIETLKGLTEIQLSAIVREILNQNRIRISTLGERKDNSPNIQYELRNVIP